MHKAGCKLLGSVITINNAFTGEDGRAGQLTALSRLLNGTTVSPFADDDYACAEGCMLSVKISQ